MSNKVHKIEAVIASTQGALILCSCGQSGKLQVPLNIRGVDSLKRAVEEEHARHVAFEASREHIQQWLGFEPGEVIPTETTAVPEHLKEVRRKKYEANMMEEQAAMFEAIKSGDVDKARDHAENMAHSARGVLTGACACLA